MGHGEMEPKQLKGLLKPRLTIIAGKTVVRLELAPAETPLEAARRRHGKPFAIDPKSTYQHTQGVAPGFWTPERLAQLAVDNERARKERRQ